MTRRRSERAARAVALAALLMSGAGASAEPPPSGAGVIAAACPGPGAASLLLLPEDKGELDAGPPGSLLVTGGYTGTDKREGDLPKPVGLYMRGGALISLEFARMDGLLVVEADGAARIAWAGDVALAERHFNLRDLDGRRAFAEAAKGASASVLQSHLLIREGALDLRPVDNAPVAERRVLFQRRDGALAIWQSEGRALTLHEAASELARLHAPVMALNLDMGGHDFCERRGADGVTSCSTLGRDGMGRMSNLLRLDAAAAGAGCE